jgi:glycerophosphoryl diester phosphodiesterase
MRPIVEEQLRGRMLPLVMAHQCGSAHGQENALETVKKALEFKPDIIEIDVRKSRDGVLYCHHGSEPFGVMAAAFFGLLTFVQIQKLVGPRDTLEKMLGGVPADMLVFLDIKDPWIGVRDLRQLIDGRQGVWIAPFGSLAWLKRLRAGLGEEHVYVFGNRPLLFPRRALERFAPYADMVQFYRWSWNAKTISEIEERGIACHMVEWFISRKEYIASMPLSRYRGLFFSIYDLNDATGLERKPFPIAVQGNRIPDSGKCSSIQPM